MTVSHFTVWFNLSGKIVFNIQVRLSYISCQDHIITFIDFSKMSLF